MQRQYKNLISGKKIFRKKQKKNKNIKLKEPLQPNERANLEVSAEINRRIHIQNEKKSPQRVIPIYADSFRNERNLSSSENPENVSDKTELIGSTANPYSLSVMIPTFVTGQTDYTANHGCRKLNWLYCDNSQNFISQCGISAKTNCQMLDMIVDCRKVMAYNFYLKGVGMDHVKYSMFGPSSKCVRIKDQQKKKSAVCLGVQCDPTGTSYWIVFPSHIGSAVLSVANQQKENRSGVFTRDKESK